MSTAETTRGGNRFAVKGGVLACAAALAVLLALPAIGQARTKFGSDLRNNDGTVTQPTDQRNCQQDANALDASQSCDRVAVQFLDTGAAANHIKAPKDGVINKLKLVALHKGAFRFELARVKNFHGGDNGKAKIVDRGERINYDSSAHGQSYTIQSFKVHDHVKKGDYLSIKSRRTSLLKCNSGSTEQLLFQPVLPVGGSFVNNNGHRSNCTLLLEALYRKHH